MNNQAANKELHIVFNIPNVVTGVRVILAAAVAVLLLNGILLAGGILFVITAITDGLDGWLARRLKQSTLGGSLLDLVADELLFMPNLIIAMSLNLFAKADGIMLLNPYLYGVPVLAGGAAVLTGVVTYILKRRKRVFKFPTPAGVAKVNFWFWLAPLILAIFDVGPGWLLAMFMYMVVISTIMTFYSYLKKGSYVFTD